MLCLKIDFGSYNEPLTPNVLMEMCTAPKHSYLANSRPIRTPWPVGH